MIYTLKLVKGYSYTGKGLFANKKSPEISTNDKAVSDMAVATGYFKLISVTEEPPEENAKELETDFSEDEISVDKMNLEQLKALAEQMGIDTANLKKKADFVQAIEASVAAKEAAAQDN